MCLQSTSAMVVKSKTKRKERKRKNDSSEDQQVRYLKLFIFSN